MARHEELKLRNMHLLDGGRPAVAFERALQIAVADCQDRPMDQTVRKVTLEIALKPSKTDPDLLSIAILTKAKIPAWVTKTYEMAPHRNGKLAFNPDSPEDPDDQNMFDHQELEDDERDSNG